MIRKKRSVDSAFSFDKFSIYAPLTRCDMMMCKALCIIYIHAPLARCDELYQKGVTLVFLFTSTHLVRGATARYSVLRYIFTISCIRFSGFHPRTPVRDATRPFPAPLSSIIRGYQFTSTHLVRDVTPFGKRPCRMRIVYIHTPRERCDLSEELTNEISMRFTSTHLVRGATWIIHHMVGIN